MILTFPWPPKQLSPNARVHWAVKAKVAKSYRSDCILTARKEWIDLVGKSKFKIIFLPPSRRRNDADNQIASFKAGFDALSFMTKVDDSKFEWTYVRGEPVKGGAVIVEVLQ
jgi:crossover junction endodeoxyribonuclease RusA